MEAIFFVAFNMKGNKKLLRTSYGKVALKVVKYHQKVSENKTRAKWNKTIYGEALTEISSSEVIKRKNLLNSRVYREIGGFSFEYFSVHSTAFTV